MTFLVIDTETTTTTSYPQPDGAVVEVGIASVDPQTGSVRPLYSSLIKTKYDQDVWIFATGRITLDELQHAPTAQQVNPALRHILSYVKVTSYNLAFDRPFVERLVPDLDIHWAPCLMESAAEVPGIPKRHPGGWPRAIDAYSALCPDDPMHLNGVEEHRALSDAMMEGHIALALIRGGYLEVSP